MKQTALTAYKEETKLSRHSTYFVEVHVSSYQGSDDQQGNSKLERGRNSRHCGLLVLLRFFAKWEK
jgi:hypothetical protein